MRKIFYIISFTLFLPFILHSQDYIGIQSLYAESDNIDDLENKRNTWLTWAKNPGYSLIQCCGSELSPLSRFGVEDLSEYVGHYITRIRYVPGSSSSGPTIFYANPRIRVYLGGSIDFSNPFGSVYDPGVMVVDYEVSSYKLGQNNTVYLPAPIQIPANSELWFGPIFYIYDGYACFTVNYNDPAVVEASYVPFKSDLMYVEWWDSFFSFSEGPIEGLSWIQAAFIEAFNCNPVTELEAGYNNDCEVVLHWNAPEDNPDAEYSIYRDNILIKEKHTETIFIDDGVYDKLKSHTWSVTAVCKEGEGGGESINLTITLAACPYCPTPIGFFVEYIENCNAAKLSWTTPSE